VRWLHGLTVVAVAVVAQAVWGMARNLASDRERASLAILAALCWSPEAPAQVLVIIAAGNAAMVGLLRAALYDPVWNSAIKSHADFGLALIAFGLLMF
jgi:chromate transporter